MIRHVATVVLTLLLISSARAADDPLETIAEKSAYKATSRHADVIAFCDRLARQSPSVRIAELGKSGEGRRLPLLIIADPPVTTPEEAARSEKLVVFAMGNIHAGEVDGKEALLQFARDLAVPKGHPLLKDCVVVLAPIFNADGNEKIARIHRPDQAGPEDGVGVRVNAQGLDLNRDFVKLETPEVRALVRFLNRWDPAVLVDCHTTNGSFHRYVITYEGGRSPAGDAKLIGLVQDEMLPEISQRMEKETGYRSYYYGGFSDDRSRWETVEASPRYSIHYVGLRNRLAILSESYTYAPFKDRVLGSRAFVKQIFTYLAEHKDNVRQALAEARANTVQAGTDLKDTTRIPLRYEAAPHGRPHQFLGYVEEDRQGRRVSTGRPKNYELLYWGGTKTTLAVRLPYGYLVPAAYVNVVENLQRHGIVVEELRETMALDVEAYRVDKTKKSAPFQGHELVSVEVTPRGEGRRIKAGTILVRTSQPLGSLAAFLLEPQSADGLTTWNFFDAALKEGRDHPVLRLPKKAALTLGRVRPLQEAR